MNEVSVACQCCNTEKPFLQKCVQCQIIMCQDCADGFHSQAPYDGHTLEGLFQEQSQFCKIHPQQILTYLCHTEQKLVCSHCIVLGDCQFHQKSDLSELNIQFDIEKNINDIQNNYRNLCIASEENVKFIFDKYQHLLGCHKKMDEYRIKIQKQFDLEGKMLEEEFLNKKEINPIQAYYLNNQMMQAHKKSLNKCQDMFIGQKNTINNFLAYIFEIQQSLKSYKELYQMEFEKMNHKYHSQQQVLGDQNRSIQPRKRGRPRKDDFRGINYFVPTQVEKEQFQVKKTGNPRGRPRLLGVQFQRKRGRPRLSESNRPELSIYKKRLFINERQNHDLDLKVEYVKQEEVYQKPKKLYRNIEKQSKKDSNSRRILERSKSNQQQQTYNQKRKYQRKVYKDDSNNNDEQEELDNYNQMKEQEENFKKKSKRNQIQDDSQEFLEKIEKQDKIENQDKIVKQDKIEIQDKIQKLDKIQKQEKIQNKDKIENQDKIQKLNQIEDFMEKLDKIEKQNQQFNVLQNINIQQYLQTYQNNDFKILNDWQKDKDGEQQQVSQNNQYYQSINQNIDFIIKQDDSIQKVQSDKISSLPTSDQNNIDMDHIIKKFFNGNNDNNQIQQIRRIKEKSPYMHRKQLIKHLVQKQSMKNLKRYQNQIIIEPIVHDESNRCNPHGLKSELLKLFQKLNDGKFNNKVYDSLDFYEELLEIQIYKDNQTFLRTYFDRFYRDQEFNVEKRLFLCFKLFENEKLQLNQFFQAFQQFLAEASFIYVQNQEIGNHLATIYTDFVVKKHLRYTQLQIDQNRNVRMQINFFQTFFLRSYQILEENDADEEQIADLTDMALKFKLT